MLFAAIRRILQKKSNRRAQREGKTTRPYSPRLDYLEDRTVPASFAVAPTGTDGTGFGSAAAPFKTIQFAVNQANTGDTILVAAGTYTYNPATDPTRATLFLSGVVGIVNKGLTIRGGYSTSNFNVANPAVNRTIIDGGGAEPGVYVISTDDRFPARLDIEGFTIQNGLAHGNSNPGVSSDEQAFAFGGGAFYDHASGTLVNMVFMNNKAKGDDNPPPAPKANSTRHGGAGSGGGIAIRNTPVGGLVTLNHVTFRNNQAIGGTGPDQGGYGIGGGLFATDGAVVSADDLEFEGNQAIAGGTSGAGNTATSRAKNEFFDGFGGGVAVGKGSNVTLTNIRVHHNEARGGPAPNGNGGGGFGGGVFAEGTADAPLFLTVRDSDIRNNLARGGDGKNSDGETVPAGVAFGGGIMTFNAQLTMDRVTVVENTSQGGTGAVLKGTTAGGGGAFLREAGVSKTTILNSVIADNSALQGGGTDERLGGGGGGLIFKGTEATLSHVTLANNKFSQTQVFNEGLRGQAILAFNPGSPTPSTVNIVNSIISNHTNTTGAAAIHVQQGNSITFNRVLFAENSLDTNVAGGPNRDPNNVPVPSGTYSGMSTVLQAPPSHPSVGFASPGSPNFDYHLLVSSVAIDQATGLPQAVDVDNGARFGIADLGADEFGVKVREDQGPATIPIRRPAGDATGTVTVSYSISIPNSLNSKQKAAPNTDFQGALEGSITFGPGEMEKTLSIPIVNDRLVEESETFVVNLSSTSGAVAPGTIAVVILDDDLPQVASAAVPAPRLQAAANGFGKSLEHYRDFVTKAYAKFLGRLPDETGQTYWVSLIQLYETSNHTQGLRQEQVEAGFIDSPEYKGRYGGVGEAWIRGIYNDLLGRGADEPGVRYWLDQLAGGTTPTLVALGFTASDERLRNRVSETYRVLLDREADSSGLAYWVAIFKQGGTTEDIISGFVGSPEYYFTKRGLGNPATWTREAYLDVLFRPATVDEFTYWLEVLKG